MRKVRFRNSIILAVPILLTLQIFFVRNIGADEEALFRFVHITDQHLVDSGRLEEAAWKERTDRGTRKFQQMPSMIKKVVSWINENDIDFVVMTGDVLENRGHAKEAWPEFVSLHKPLKVPYYVVPGNHDFGLEKRIPPESGGIDFYFTCGGIIFAGFQTFITRFSGMVELVDGRSLEKLAALAEANQAHPIIILCHSPLYPGEKVPSWAPPRNAESVQQVLERCGNVFLVLQAHIHALTNNIHNGIRYITCPGFVEAPTFSFLVWTVHSDRIEGKLLAASKTPIEEIGQLLIQVPKRFRGQLSKPGPGDLKAKSPPSSEGQLAKWFGEDWSHYPGGTPIAWTEEKIVLRRSSPGWKFTSKKEPLADSSGQQWYHPAYSAQDWEEAELPAVYGYRRNKAAKVKIGTSLKETNTCHYFRLSFSMPFSPDKDKQAMLRVASDKWADVYLNGVIIDRDNLLHWADYWNRYVIFSSSVLKEKENLLALKLTNPYKSSHGFLDTEIALSDLPFKEEKDASSPAKNVEVQNTTTPSVGKHTVCLWHFDEEGRETVSDAGPNKKNGLRKGESPPRYVPAKYGKGLRFDGKGEVVVKDGGRNDPLDITKEITCETWLKVEAVEGRSMILYKGAAYQLAIASNAIPVFGVKTEGGWTFAAANSALPLNTWVHVAGTYDGKTVSVLINRELKARVKHSSPGEILSSGDYALVIGSRFRGIIDEIHLSDTIRYVY